MPGDEVAGWVRGFKAHPSWSLWSDVQWDRNHLAMLLGHYDHQKWIRAVMEAGVLPVEDHRECRFGRWYEAEGRASFGDLPEFLAIGKIHESLHRHAADLLAAQAGSPEDDQVLVSLCDAFQEKLTELQRAAAGL
jgi:hypothetical protein